MKSELAEKKTGEMGSKVGEYRKKLKIVDIKGGPDEGWDRVGQTLVFMDWVRILCAQSSVTFIEVGELIGGSQREERIEYLEGHLDDLKLNRDWLLVES